MMNEAQIQSMVTELENQRNWALTRCANIQADLAKSNQEKQVLESQIKNLQEKLKAVETANEVN